MSSTTEFAELHELIGGLRRCVTSLASRYGDSPGMRRIVNDTERIATIVTEQISTMEGVTATRTLIAFRQYDPADIQF